jgi:D-3-phosphoglycerate dehydrogenase / 2-oxoglutarate reductase
MSKYRVLITTSPFGKCGDKPIRILEETGWEIIQNPYNRRLKADEVFDLIQDVDAVIAGTEPYPIDKLPKNGNRLKVISRVGIGLDNINLSDCLERGIKVTYTPDAPSQGVAELTIENILNLSRYISMSDRSVRAKAWNRYLGKLVREMTIGVVGVGRIGKIVIELLSAFKPKIIATEIEPDIAFSKKYNFQWVSKEELLQQADLVTLHIPGGKQNYNYIDRTALALMKTGSLLINTSRGSVLDEEAVHDALLQHHLGGAALDVFKEEPYEGPLTSHENVVLTAHMGASANESRYYMELGAVEDCVQVLMGEEPKIDAIKMNPNLLGI